MYGFFVSLAIADEGYEGVADDGVLTDIDELEKFFYDSKISRTKKDLK